MTAYPWVGARPLAGRSSIGYRSVVYMPSDGVEQSMAWLDDHARLGDRVAAYVQESAMKEGLAWGAKYRLTLNPAKADLWAYDSSSST